MESFNLLSQKDWFMATVSIGSTLEAKVLSGLESIPVISSYRKTRGWYFVISWMHRITGIFLVLFLWYHIYSLSFLVTPGAYEAKMQLLQAPLFIFLEWALAMPVLFHSLNGGRLILFEIHGQRNDRVMMRWVFALSAIYVVLLGFFMIMGDQMVSFFLFWLITFVVSVLVVYGFGIKLWREEHSWTWKLQRISGVFLLVMVPAHLFFMHLNPSMAKDAGVVIARMQSVFIKVVDLLLLAGIVYHGAYGLAAVASDYAARRAVRVGVSMAIIGVMGVVAVVGAWVIVAL